MRDRRYAAHAFNGTQLSKQLRIDFYGQRIAHVRHAGDNFAGQIRDRARHLRLLRTNAFQVYGALISPDLRQRRQREINPHFNKRRSDLVGRNRRMQGRRTHGAGEHGQEIAHQQAPRQLALAAAYTFAHRGARLAGWAGYSAGMRSANMPDLIEVSEAGQAPFAFDERVLLAESAERRFEEK
jgi:hypothetical protein